MLHVMNEGHVQKLGEEILLSVELNGSSWPWNGEA